MHGQVLISVCQMLSQRALERDVWEGKTNSRANSKGYTQDHVCLCVSVYNTQIMDDIS